MDEDEGTRYYHRSGDIRVSLEQLRALILKTNGGSLSESDLDDLEIWVNNALVTYSRMMAAKESALPPTELKKAAYKFRAALKKLELSLPEKRSHLFWAVAEKGDELFAKREGKQIGSTDFRSARRLDELCDAVQEVSSWLDASFSPSRPEQDLSASELLIGEVLPQIYERFFGETYVKDRKSNGVAFVLAILKAAKVKSQTGSPFSIETVIVYRNRAISKRSGS